MSRVVAWYKLVSNRQVGDCIGRDAGHRLEIQSADDPKLAEIEDFSELLPSLNKGGHGAKSVQCGEITQDLKKILLHNSRTLRPMVESLFSENPSHYILLGHLTTDYVENIFGQLRQGSGAYYCNSQQVLQKIRNFNAKSLFKNASSSEVAVYLEDAKLGHTVETRLLSL